MLTWEASAEAAIKNTERIVPTPAPANLQELRLGSSLKILGEVKVFVFIFGVHVSGLKVKLFILGVGVHVDGIENIVVFRRVEEGVSRDSCRILR